MATLHPTFLDGPQEYANVEALWKAQWDRLIGHLGEAEMWRSPWIGTTFADGTPILDGNPIFSAFSPGRKLGIRVIQLEPTEDATNFTAWTDTFAKDDDDEELQELVICCVLSDETLLEAAAAMTQWITGRQSWVQQEWPSARFPLFPRKQMSREYLLLPN